MKKRWIVMLGIMLVVAFGGYLTYSKLFVPSKYVGIWNSESSGKTIEIFRDGTVFYYQKGKSSDKEIIYTAEEGKLSDGHIIMKDRFDSQGCLDTYSAVEEIPKDDFLPISIVYDIEFQGTEACTIINAERRNTDQRVAFVKSSNKVKKEKLGEKKEASDYQITVFFDEDISEQKLAELKNEIEKMNGVVSVTYISPEKAWENFQETYYKEGEVLVDGFKDDNPLANSGNFQVVYKVKYREALLENIEALEGIRKINS